MCKIKILPVKVTLFTDVQQQQQQRTSALIILTPQRFCSKLIIPFFLLQREFWKHDPLFTSCFADLHKQAQWQRLFQTQISAIGQYKLSFILKPFPYITLPVFHTGWQWENAGGQQQREISHRAPSTSGMSTRESDQQEQWKCLIKNIQSQWKDCVESSKHSKWN